MEKLNQINAGYNFKSDISYILDEKVNWDMPKEKWEVYGVVDISKYLLIKEQKALKIELEKRGLRYGTHRTPTGKTKTGFKIPKLDSYY